jgi:hypothetical protein
VSRFLQRPFSVPVLFLLAAVPYLIGATGCPLVPTTPSDQTGGDQTGGNTNPGGDTTKPTNGAPHITFGEPIANSVFTNGDSIAISFSGNDPENAFSYDLFYDVDGSLNGNEISISKGNSNGNSNIAVLWPTTNVPPGSYFIGAVVVDNAGQTDHAFVGPITIQTGARMVVTAPAQSLAVTVGDGVSVSYSGTDSTSGGTIDVFYDTDDSYGNGVSGYIDQGLSQSTTTSTWNTTGVVPGIYYVGALIARVNGTRVAAYAPGQVRVNAADSQTGKSLAGLTLEITQPVSGVTLARGAVLPLAFRGRDSANQATINLFYDTNSVYDDGYTNFAMNLALTETSFNWTADIAPGLYRVGASIGRNATDRVVVYAPGRVLINPPSGGGADQLTVTFASIEPTTAIKMGIKDRKDLAFTLSNPVAVGTIDFAYALDADNNHVADGAWTTFATVTRTSGTFTFDANGLAAGRYLIQGTYTRAPGTSYTPTATRVADGNIEVTSTRGLVVTEISKPTVVQANSQSSGMTFQFQVLNPLPGDYLQFFADWDRDPGGEAVLGDSSPGSNAYFPLQITDTSLTVTDIFFPSGLWFFGFSLGTSGADRVYAYTPGCVFAYDSTSAAPFDKVPGVFTAIEPSTDQLLVEGSTVDARWFVNSTNVAGSIRLFFEGITNGAPNGNRYNQMTVADPRRSLGALSTTGLASGLYFVGMTFDRPAPDAPITLYAAGKIHVVPQNDLFLEVTGPSQNIITRAGNGPIQVDLQALDPNGTANINIFLDQDRVYNTNELVRLSNLPLTTRTRYIDTNGLSPGIYFVGASIGQTSLNRKAAYAPGAIYVLGPSEPWLSETLTVLAPVAPSVSVNRGANITVKWFINSPINGGTIDIFAEQQDANGNRLGPSFRTPAPTLPPTPPVPYDCLFSFDTSALSVATMYSIGVTYTPPGAGSTPVTRYAPGTLFIRPASQYVWMGDTGTPSSPGVVMRGFNFNDFAGSSVAPVKDIDGDGIPDFMVVSQFGKPKLEMADGTGRGEAYLIYGGAALSGMDVDLNRTGESLANSGLPGLIFSGLQPADLTSGSNFGGISSVMAIRDQDGDNHPELLFAIPKCPDKQQGALSKNGQFLRGGFVIASSQTPRITQRDVRDGDGSRNLELSTVGMGFSAYDLGTLSTTAHWRCSPGGINNDDCNACQAADPTTGAKCTNVFENPVCPTTTVQKCNETAYDTGGSFTADLVDLSTANIGLNSRIWSNGGCACPSPLDPIFTNPADAFQVLDPGTLTKSKGCDGKGLIPAINSAGKVIGVYLGTGFYAGSAQEPYGCRVLGQNDNDLFGQSVSVVDDMLLIGAPEQSADLRSGNGQVFELKIKAPTNNRTDQYGYPGVDVTVKPHQYIAEAKAFCPSSFPGFNEAGTSNYLMFGGADGDRAGATVCGVTDFNGDAKGDVLVGAPNAFPASAGGDNSGAVYLVYRRTAAVEGQYDLKSIERDLADRERLNGVLIRGRGGEYLGQALGPGTDLNGSGQQVSFDFNHDGLPDVVFGNQNYAGTRGEVVILFGNRQLLSRAGGFRIEGAVDRQDDLLDHQDVDVFGNRKEHPLCAVIRGELDDPAYGNFSTGLAGYNVSYAGDFDHDGKPDLLIAAPDASPFVDINNDGNAEHLTHAGVVYLVFGSNDFGVDKNGNGVLDQDEVVFNLSDIRTGKMKGLIFAGRNPEDHLGGGEVVDNAHGGFGTTGMRAHSVSWAGDVNNDGFDDILIGAPLASPFGKTHAGEVYLVFGFSQ